MTVTIDSFRAAFNAFGNAANFPGPEIDFWIALAANLHNADRYGNMLDAAVMLFVAHNISLEFSSRQAGLNGQNPGQVQGAITGMTVDKVSYSRDPSGSMDPRNGHWNLTHYGQRWKDLARLMGAGPIQIGSPSADDFFPGAWPGPMPTVF